jgi:hypothetical protein
VTVFYVSLLLFKPSVDDRRPRFFSTEALVKGGFRV